MTRVRYGQHECNTIATVVTRVQHEWDTSNTSATQVQHECYTNDTSVTRVKNFNFVTARVKTYFHTLIFTIWQVKGYKERNNLILRTTFWKLSLFHAKIRLKSAPQKLNFLMEKATSKSCTLDCSYKCSCTFPHSYAQ